MKWRFISWLALWSEPTGRPSTPRPGGIRLTNGITLLLATACLWLSPSVGLASDTLTCDPTKTIGEAIEKLEPGETLLVSGMCDENVDVGEEVHDITLDGRGTATINGDSSVNTVTVKGRGITIRGFTITGGFEGIAVLDGGSAVIDGNTIQNAARNGITVFRNSTAHIINNTIQDNASSGIQSQHSSSARIGFTGPPGNRVRAPNTIQNNGASGIQVLRGASVQIFANTIQNNGSHGVLVDRNSQAEVAACTITGNTGDGIRGTRNAGVDIGTDATGATPEFEDDTNTGTNGGFGVRCMIDGFVDGLLGSLTGTNGGQFFAEGCTDSVLP
jgi:parallel beta-helix repeat protein